MLRRLSAVLAVLTTVVAAGAAHAGLTTDGWGPRIGFSLTPDQVVLGGQVTFAEVAPHIAFTPSLELGLGDHQTDVQLNADFVYRFVLHDTDWRPYAGAGVGLDFVSVDEPAPFRDQSDTFGGGTFIFGVTAPTRSNSNFFGEIRLGLGDLPDMKIMAGWNFPLH